MSDLPHNINLTDDAQRWLDRLADGELNADQQRQLLLALEAQPEQWRRCALAFVEAQIWRGEFQRLSGNAENILPTATGASASAATILHSRRPAWLGRMGLALAASILAAFTLGLAARGWWWNGSGQDGTNQLATATTAATPASGAAENVASTEKNPSAEQPSPESNAVAGANSTANNSSKWQALKVTLPTADGQGEQTVEVPLVAASEAEVQAKWSKQEPVLSDTAVQTLQSTGHEVEQHRAYYTVQLEDGMQAVLPMDYVEVTDTGNWQ